MTLARYLFSTTLFLLTGSILCAEDAPPPVRASISLAIWNDGYNLGAIADENPSELGQVLYFATQGSVEKALAPYGRFGQPVEYRGGVSVPLYLSAPAPDQPPPDPACILTLKPGTQEIAVMLYPDAGAHSKSYRALVIDMSPSALPPSSILLQSLYRTPLYARMGEEMFTLKPFEKHLVRPDSASSRGLPLQVVIKDEDTQQARPLLRRFISLRGQQRVAAFILPDPIKNKVADLRVITLPPISEP